MTGQIFVANRTGSVAVGINAVPTAWKHVMTRMPAVSALDVRELQLVHASASASPGTTPVSTQMAADVTMPVMVAGQVTSICAAAEKKIRSNVPTPALKVTWQLTASTLVVKVDGAGAASSALAGVGVAKAKSAVTTTPVTVMRAAFRKFISNLSFPHPASPGAPVPFDVMERRPMVRLTTADSAFEARVVAARLGADGIVTELRGAALDSLYPTPGPVDLYVSIDDFELARDLLAPGPTAEEATRSAEAVSFVPAWVWMSALVLVALFALLLVRDIVAMIRR